MPDPRRDTHACCGGPELLPLLPEDPAMLIAIWTLALLGIALWTLAAWGLHALLTLDPSRLQDLKPLIHEIPYGELIDQWIPAWRTMLALAIDLTQKLVGWVGHAADWIVWLLWAAGTGVAVLVAGVLSLSVVLIRRGMAASEAQRLAAQGQR
jgi:hypothetical protein